VLYLSAIEQHLLITSGNNIIFLPTNIDFSVDCQDKFPFYPAFITDQRVFLFYKTKERSVSAQPVKETDRLFYGGMRKR
jgi:hypothetical protein